VCACTTHPTWSITSCQRPSTSRTPGRLSQPKLQACLYTSGWASAAGGESVIHVGVGLCGRWCGEAWEAECSRPARHKLSRHNRQQRRQPSLAAPAGCRICLPQSMPQAARTYDCVAPWLVEEPGRGGRGTGQDRAGKGRAGRGRAQSAYHTEQLLRAVRGSSQCGAAPQGSHWQPATKAWACQLPPSVAR